jgi:hypothetical protein
VRRLLGEEDEDRGAHIATRCAPARPKRLAEASGTTETGGEVGRIEGRPSPAMAVPGPMLEVLPNVVVEACGGFVVGPRALVVVGWVRVFPGHVGSLHGG